MAAIDSPARTPEPERLPQPTSWNDFALNTLTPLAAAAGLSHKMPIVQAGFELLSDPWGNTPIPEEPAWLSDVCSDHSVFEPSLALSAQGNVLRVLVEAQGADGTLAGQAVAGRALTQRIAAEFGLSVERCRALEQLFLEETPALGGPTQGRFGVWHAIEVGPDSRVPSVKVYFDLSAWGKASAAALAEEALQRIGFASAWPSIGELLSKQRMHTELAYFSVDAGDEGHARVKIYLRHHGATAEGLDACFSSATQYRPGSVKTALCELGVGDGPYLERPIVASYSFTKAQAVVPSHATLYFPLESYVENDAESMARLEGYCGNLGLPLMQLQAAVEGIAPGPLRDGHGLISYVSFREEQGKPRSTVYFSPQAFERRGAGVLQREVSRSRIKAALGGESISELVERFEREPLTLHPFLRRLAREPVNLSHLALLMSNFNLAIVQEFPRRLAALTARAPNDEFRALLAAQLHDELGSGDFAQAHKALFERLLKGLSQYRSAQDDTASALLPAADLGRALEYEYVTADPWFGIGASLLVEVFGKQVDTFVAEQFARQQAVTGETLEWLDLHTVLEVEHAEDSRRLAALIPTGAPEAQAIAGAEHIANASTAFFNAMYAVAFNA